jgi:1-acyl-sn-glycerol-3-phosphate acyltransferase
MFEFLKQQSDALKQDPTRESLHPWLKRMGHKGFWPIRLYHRYNVVGLENIPRTGRAIMAVSHSFATYDGFLLAMAIYEATGRLPAGLGDNLIFKIPGLAYFAETVGIHPANHENGESLLDNERLLALAPGGMREALRPSSERYQIRWDRRKGFVRLSIKTNSPIILAACPAADDLYSIYEWSGTKVGYKQMKVPVPLFRGLGLSLIPRPVKLTHAISPPLHPPVYDESCFDEQVDEFHAQIVETMKMLMAEFAPDS